MVDAVKKYSGVDFKEIKTLEEARAAAEETPCRIRRNATNVEIS